MRTARRQPQSALLGPCSYADERSGTQLRQLRILARLGNARGSIIRKS